MSTTASGRRSNRDVLFYPLLFPFCTIKRPSDSFWKGEQGKRKDLRDMQVLQVLYFVLQMWTLLNRMRSP